MRKFNLSNLSFLVIMTLIGFILLPLEIIIFAMINIYIPFEYLIFNVKYKSFFKKYKFLFLVRFKKTISIYKSLLRRDITNVIYDDSYRCFIVDNKVIVIKNGLKCEKTINENLLSNIEKKYNTKIVNMINI